MNEKTENRELQQQFAVLEERMNTHEARIDATLNALRTDIERGHKEAAERSHTQTRWTVGVIIATVAVGTGVIVGSVGVFLQLFVTGS